MFRIRSLAAALFISTGLFAQATVTPLGQGCPNSNGTPVLSVNQGGWLRETSTFTVTNLPQLQSGAIIIFAGGASVNTWGGFTIPADLGVLGAPGCTLFVSPTFTGTEPYSGDTANFSILVPNNAFLLTCNAVIQCGVCDMTLGTPLDLSLSNALSITFGSR